ncbi:helix-turn-helix domain-containing protein [Actinokineospora sp.]|uniref:helix-turn-helix domain-containing protein n=1 Tax=Actinokineospora sp. TaxID=1872133 RepID=UPI003D6B97B4
MLGADPVVTQIQLGLLLRTLRTSADLTALEAGAHIGLTNASMSRIEGGKQAIKPDDVLALLDIYRADDAATAEALRLASVPRPRARRKRGQSYRDAVPNWFKRFLVMESEASDVLVYENETVTGLLQTEDYARILLQSGAPMAGTHEIDKQVDLRISRQHILTRTDPAPPLLDLIMHESVLHRVIGDDKIMAAQLKHLVKVSKLPSVRLQILPFHPKPTPNRDEAFTAKSQFMLLRLPEQGTVLYLEDFTGATYPEDYTVIDQYAASFQRLRSAAADPAESRALIGRITKQYE